MHALHEKLSDELNDVESERAYRGLRCRDAEAVLSSHYANRLEAAALSLAAIRALGLTAEPAVAVDARAADPNLETDAGFEQVIIVVEHADGPLYFHPRLGLFANPGRWGEHRLIRLRGDGHVDITDVLHRGAPDCSDLRIAGALTIEEPGHVSGTLQVRLTGAFYNPIELRSQEKQKAFVSALVGRVLADAEVESFSIETLSAEELRLSAEIQWAGTSLADDAGRMLQLTDKPACLRDFALPLTPANRRTDVRLSGPFRSTIDLVVKTPEEWAITGAPTSATTEGAWGVVTQQANVAGDQMRLHRMIWIRQPRLAPEWIDKIATALNDLRAIGGRTILLRAPGPKS